MEKVCTKGNGSAATEACIDIRTWGKKSDDHFDSPALSAPAMYQTEINKSNNGDNSETVTSSITSRLL